MRQAVIMHEKFSETRQSVEYMSIEQLLDAYEQVEINEWVEYKLQDHQNKLVEEAKQANRSAPPM